MFVVKAHKKVLSGKNVYMKYGQSYRDKENDVDCFYTTLKECDRFETYAAAKAMRDLYEEDSAGMDQIVETK